MFQLTRAAMYQALSCRLRRWAYQAKVMKTLEQSNKTTVFHMVGITGSAHSSDGGATLQRRRHSRRLWHIWLYVNAAPGAILQARWACRSILPQTWRQNPGVRP